MKPSTEKMAKPATKLVPLFRQHSMMQSLRSKRKEKEITVIERAFTGLHLQTGNTDILPHTVSCTDMLADMLKIMPVGLYLYSSILYDVKYTVYKVI